MWDAGGASVNAVATTFVFTVYLTSGLFGDGTESTSVLTHWMTAAGIIVALTAPITGQRADRRGKGTFWLGVFSTITIVTLFLMYFVQPEPTTLWGMQLSTNFFLMLGCALVAIMTIFFEFASVNYFAMLPRISDKNNIGRISGFGWAAGYFGGIFLLMFLNFGFITDNNWFGISGENGMGIRSAMVVAAIWSILFFYPVLFFVRGRKVPGADDLPRESIVKSYKNLFQTIKVLFQKAPHTLFFLLASAIFRDGLAGVFTYGGILAGVTFGFSAGEVIAFAVVANITAGIATSLIGYLDDRLGPKKVMVGSLAVLVVTCMIIFGLALYFKAHLFHDGLPDKKWIMWTFGLFLTLWVGPAQSASRSFLSRRIPEGNEGEVFGLYQTTGRAVTFLAPAMFGAFIWIGQQIYGEGANVQYWGILGISLILLAGLILLLFVKEDKAHLAHIDHN